MDGGYAHLLLSWNPLRRFSTDPLWIRDIVNKDFSSITSAHRFYFFTCLITTLLVVIYGIIEARQIKTEHLIIPTNKISAGIGKVRIVQISDVHLGLIIGAERVKRIVKAVQTAKPDILVSTGDLVDVQLDNIDGLAGLFHEVDDTVWEICSNR